jgi:hypothetical protein
MPNPELRDQWLPAALQSRIWAIFGSKIAFMPMIEPMPHRASLELLPPPNIPDFLDKVWCLA